MNRAGSEKSTETSRAAARADALLKSLSLDQVPTRGGDEEVGRRPSGPRIAHPLADTIFRARRLMGLTLVGLGLVEFVAHWFLPYNGTVMATQTPVGFESVGRVRSTPESSTVSRIYPQLNIAIGSLIVGGVLLLTSTWRDAQVLFIEQCNRYLSYIVHIQACFESMILIITVLPLAGVVNVYELAMASMLTVAQYFVMLFSDMSNQVQLSHWETAEAYRARRDEPPDAAFRKAGVGVAAKLGFHWMPIVLMLVIFTFLWVIIFLHLGEAMTSSVYSVEPDFQAIVFFTGIMQALIPILKVIQLARPWLFVSRNYCTYKSIVMAIDMVEFINMTFVGLVLVFAYGTVPKQ